MVQSHNGSRYDEPGGSSTSPDFQWPSFELLREHGNVFSALFAFKKEGQLNAAS